MWEYQINVLRVLDGDTVDARIDLGFKIHHNIRIRIYGLNTPETRTRDLEEKKAGLESKAALKEWIQNADRVILKSHGVGKFGRCLGELFVRMDDDSQFSVTDRMIAEGLGKPYFGGKR